MIKHTSPLFGRFVQGIAFAFVFIAIGIVGEDDYQHAQAQPIDWADSQKQTLANLYKHYTPEKAQKLAEFYGIHDARQHCINQGLNQNQQQFNNCIAGK